MKEDLVKLHMVLDIHNTAKHILTQETALLDKSRIREIAFAFLDAYVDTIDYEGENIDDAIEEIKKVFSNGYGNYSDEYSGAIEINNKIASMLFAVSDGNKVFIPYVTTIKKESGKGLAEQLPSDLMEV